ncbi:hypothetical protein [Acetivibrio cellulolyticus]|uniref:hypothetical protein n=1 Tax=Acetivibrio cellulolyticus TaxID=35830 RepID=UPI0001E2F0EF|nr:hypothetical protein [Acetivibrio cellulolyticus]
MGDSLGKIIAIVLAVLLLFIYPTKNEFERLDETSRIYVLTETSKFVDSVRNLGYITPVMYEEFSSRLAATNNLYEIKMEHRKKRYDPVYDDPTAGVSAPLADDADEADEADTEDPAEGEAEAEEEDIGPVDFVVGYRTYYNGTILESMFPDHPIVEGENRNYELEKGDYFAVTVYNKNKTMATRLQEMLYNTSLSAQKIYVRYGGMIKDENN